VPPDRQPVPGGLRDHRPAKRQSRLHRVNGARMSAQKDLGYVGSCSPSA
jgi:hypothetical protein